MLHLLGCIVIFQVSVVFHLLVGLMILSLLIWLLVVVVIFFWRVAIVKASEKFMCDCTLWLHDFLQGTTLSINDTKDSLEWLSDNLAQVNHALVCILHLFILCLDDTMIARVVHHHKEISFLNHIFFCKF